jgi:spore coat polysaccharide biosynthesis protein SpsF
MVHSMTAAVRRPKVVATIEARMAASRLPGKVLLPAVGRTLLELMVERVRRSRSVDEVVVATTVHPPDRAIIDLCRRIGCPAHAGPVEDIAERLSGAVRAAGGDVVVQLTGDCPLVDPDHIDRTVELLIGGDFDYAGNNLDGGFSIGFDVRAFTLAALDRAMTLSDDPIDRVHGSYFIHRRPDLFRHGSWTAEGAARRPDLRLTVDEPGDYELIRRVFEALTPTKPAFDAMDVVNLMDANPDWRALNQAVRQKTADEG